MRQNKKIITRLCINNWGGISRQVMEFHEYVNLFSGMSGSGKSTVMDAIQVLLYGSLSQTFLNKAADEKNRRTVLAYLRGAQKDGTQNRGERDFCSVLAMEILDTTDQSYRCVGVAFEVRSGDTDVNRYAFFSHDGMFDSSLYVNEKGSVLTLKEISELVKRHVRDPKGRTRGEDLNRVYATNDAYQSALWDQVFGYIDGRRFVTMEKSAVALRMSNGVGQFIKDYMFPKSNNEAIEKISRQLGDYADIRETVLDMERRIQMLEEVREADRLRALANAAVFQNEYILKKLRILGIEEEIVQFQTQILEKEQVLGELSKTREEKKAVMERVHTELVEIESSLKASDYGKLKEQLEQIDETITLLNRDCALWDHVITNLAQWEENETVSSLVSNAALWAMDEIREGKVTAETIQNLRAALKEALEAVDEERDQLAGERRELKKDVEEKKARLSDWKSGQKSYRNRPGLKEAARALEAAIFRESGKKVKVGILADLFDVRDAVWKDALEGRLARVKYSLVTPPEYSHLAAVLFRRMKEYENVDLLHVANIMADNPSVREGSLYEAVTTDVDYVDVCLRHFLGRVIKCSSVEELENVKDGVTADCYSYGNYALRHLNKRDYRENACIGRTIAKSRIDALEEEIRDEEERLSEFGRTIHELEAARGYESLREEDERYLELFGARAKRGRSEKKREELAKKLHELEDGELGTLKRRLKETKAAYKAAQDAHEQVGTEYTQTVQQIGYLKGELRGQNEQLALARTGFVANEEQDAQIASERASQSIASLRVKTQRELETARTAFEESSQKRQSARMAFNMAYSSAGFTGLEESNQVYDELYERYRRQYVEEYKEQFDRKCEEVYKSLRDNVIATIHGDIKSAFRQVREVNKVLGETAFSDSVYKIGITPATNENSQFYEMLMAPELDSKAMRADDVDGQMSLGDDLFEQKYAKEIELLVEKFLPDRSGDAEHAKRRRAQMEQYADYRNYLTFNMYEVTVGADGKEKRIAVDEMAGNDSGGEGQNPKYVALFAGFALLFASQLHRDSRIRVVLLDEAFSKMDKTRSSVCLNYARRLGLQVIICVPDERLMTLVKNVDCVYGFRRHQNQISMLMIDKGRYLSLLEGEEDEQTGENVDESGGVDHLQV